MRKLRTHGIYQCVAGLAAACLLAGSAAAQTGLGAAAAEGLVRQVWYEGFPLERAAHLDATGFDRLVAMLADPLEEEHHANILLALAASGGPGALEAISAWQDRGLSGEAERPLFRAWQVLPHALGVLARHDPRALDLLGALLEGRTPTWRFRHHDGPRLKRLSQRAAASALARSGRPEAAVLLRRAALRAERGSTLRDHIEACRAMHRSLQEHAQ